MPDNPTYRDEGDPREQIAAMKRDMEQMANTIQRLASASSIEHILCHGLSALSEQLQPLKDLTPKRTLMTEEDAARLASVRAELARQTWTGTGTLDLPPGKGYRPGGVPDGNVIGLRPTSSTSGSAS